MESALFTVADWEPILDQIQFGEKTVEASCRRG